MIEDTFAERVKAGKDDPQSAVIGMFLAKKHDPSYRDNANVNVQLAGPVAIQFNLTNSTPAQALSTESATPDDSTQ